MRSIITFFSAAVLAACASSPVPETQVTADTAAKTAPFDAASHLWLED